jgi:hypothetical protein
MAMVAPKHNCRNGHGSGTIIKRRFGSGSSKTHATAEIEDCIITNLKSVHHTITVQNHTYLKTKEGFKTQALQWPSELNFWVSSLVLTTLRGSRFPISLTHGRVQENNCLEHSLPNIKGSLVLVVLWTYLGCLTSPANAQLHSSPKLFNWLRLR